MPKGEFPCISVGTGFEPVRLISGEKQALEGTPKFTLQFGRRYFASVDLHRSKRTKSFHFGLKPQIAASHYVYREGRRIINSK